MLGIWTYKKGMKKYSGKINNTDKKHAIYSPKGRSCVLDGVRTMGRLALALLALLKPVAEVSTSDMIPGSSSYTLEGGGWYSEWLRWLGKWLCERKRRD